MVVDPDEAYPQQVNNVWCRNPEKGQKPAAVLEVQLLN